MRITLAHRLRVIQCLPILGDSPRRIVSHCLPEPPVIRGLLRIVSHCLPEPPVIRGLVHNRQCLGYVPVGAIPSDFDRLVYLLDIRRAEARSLAYRLYHLDDYILLAAQIYPDIGFIDESIQELPAILRAIEVELSPVWRLLRQGILMEDGHFL